MSKITPAYAITLTLLSCISFAMPILAKPATPPERSINTLIRDTNTRNSSSVTDSKKPRFTPPSLPLSGTPTGRVRGAAGRGGVNCALKPPLTALVPATEKSVGRGKATYVWGKTSYEKPTFWFYLPNARPVLRSVEFVLQDEQDNDVYRTLVNLPEKPGIIGIQLPSTSASLKSNQNYRWFLKTESEVSCNRQNPSLLKDSVEGWVQRVELEPTLASQLKTATPEQRFAFYAQNGFWYDALTTLAELRLRQPFNATLQTDWNTLLQSAGLSEVASQSLVQCCTVTRIGLSYRIQF